MCYLFVCLLFLRSFETDTSFLDMYVNNETIKLHKTMIFLCRLYLFIPLKVCLKKMCSLHTYMYIPHFQNGGTCDFSITSNDIFTIVPCTCPTGYVGSYCELDEDGCADNPCFTGVQCSDVPASQLATTPAGFSCASCPVGMVGDGQTCGGMLYCSKHLYIFLNIIFVIIQSK